MKSLATLAVILIAFTGCASDESDQSPIEREFASQADSAEDDSLESAKEYGLTDQQIEESFTAVLKNTWPSDFAPVDNETLVELGYLVCGAFDSGFSFEEAAGNMIEAGYSYEVAGGFIGSATAAFCPEHTDKY